MVARAGTTTLIPMAGDDDLDWLYRRDRPRTAAERAGVERTRVYSPEEVAAMKKQVRRGAETSAREPVTPVPAPPPIDPPNRRSTTRRRRRPGRAVAAVIILVVVALVAWLVAVPLVAWNETESIDDQPAGERIADQPGRTYLLVGSDSRDGLTKDEAKKLGTGEVGGERADTMMILYVPPEGRPALVSLPRDLYVSIPGHGKNKINAAFAFGGAKLLTETVEQLTGLWIDHYVGIGFGGFVSIIDALGGIEMCIPDDIKDKNSHLDVKAGCQIFDGPTALGYVRMRYQDPEGDLGRVKRQREMIGAVASKAASAESVLNPVRYWKLNHALAGALTLGETTGLADMPAMALAMLDLSKDGALTLTVPVAGNISTPAGSSLALDEDKATDMFSTIASGSTGGLEKFLKKK